MPTLLSLKNLAIAGLVGELAFEAYAWLISPLLFGVALAPSNLVMALTNIAFGLEIPHWFAFVIHFSIGAFGFAAFVFATHLVSKTSMILSGAITGFVLWFIAQGILAPVVGRSFMMDFGAYTQSSFIGHVGMAILIGFVFRKLSNLNDLANTVS